MGPGQLPAQLDAGGIGREVADLGQRRFEVAERRPVPLGREEEARELRARAGGRGPFAVRRLPVDELAQERLGDIEARRGTPCDGRLVPQQRARRVVIDELERPLQVGEGLTGHAQGECPGRREPEGADRAPGQDRGIGVARGGAGCSQQVLGHGLHQLLVVQGLQVVRSGQVDRPALSARHRAVGDVADDFLDERELAAAGRAGLVVEGHELAPDEGGDARLRLGRLEAADRHEGLGMEAPTEDRRREEHAPVARRERVDPGRDERAEGLRDLHPVRRFEHLQTLFPGAGLAAVDQHPQHLHPVQRHAAGALDDPLHDARRKVRPEAEEQFGHLLVGQGLELDRREAVVTGAPRRAACRGAQGGRGPR